MAKDKKPEAPPAEAPEAPEAPPAPVPETYIVASGVSLMCATGVKVAGDAITEKDIAGGKENFDALVKSKAVVVGK
jgi:hypothetical protein